MNENEIEIINFNNKLTEGYKLNKTKIIHEENLEKILDNQNSDKIIMTSQIIEKYIIIISVKVKNMLELNNKKEKDIQLDNFNITIIEHDFEKNKFKQIMINIPIKKDINISKKIFFNQKFYFFDLVPIDNTKSFFILYIFDQLHFFKLYQKEEQLKYNKIKVKNFDKETNIIYIGKNLKLDKNVLEIELLLKPKNCFYFIPIDITDSNKKLEENEYNLNEKENKNIFNKYIKSNCDTFIFTDKNLNQNYIVTKDDNSNEIIIKELIINSIGNNQIKELTIIFLFKIKDKIYLISHLRNNSEEDGQNKYSIFEIYNVFYVVKDNNYNMELLQQIKILNNEGIKDYNFNMNNSNNIFINIGRKLYIFHLGQSGVIDVINIFQLDSNLNFDKYYYEKYQQMTSLIIILNNDIFFSKNADEFLQEKKYILNNDINYIEENKDNNKEQDESNDDENLINDKPKEKDEIEKPISESKLLKLVNESKNPKINIEIESIILNRIKFNEDKIDKYVKENANKIKLIKQDIKFQKEEHKKFKEYYEKLSNIINGITKIINNADNEEIEEEEEIDNKMNYNYNHNYRNFQREATQNYSNCNNNLINQMNIPLQKSSSYNYQNYSYNNNGQLNPYLMNQKYQNGNMINNNY